MSFISIHRVVTGHDADGKSIVASNGPLSTIRELESLPGMIFHEVWETRDTPAPVDNCPDPTGGQLSHQAPKNGTCMRFVDFPPDSSYLAQAEVRMKELFKEVNDVSALTVKPDSPHPMMHRSEAIDYGIVIEGEMTLVLDDSEVLLKPGSVVYSAALTTLGRTAPTRCAVFCIFRSTDSMSLRSRRHSRVDKIGSDHKVARGKSLGEFFIDG